MKKFLSLTLALALSLSASVIPGAFAQANVAEVNGVGYPTLQAAVDAAGSGDVVTLLDTVEESVIIADDDNIVLDLNNYGILGPYDGNKADAHQQYLYTHTPIVNKGTLKVIGSGLVDARQDSVAAIYNFGHATLNGGYYTRSLAKPSGTSNTFYTILNGGTMIINQGVTADNLKNASTIENGRVKDGVYGVLTINGGYFLNGRHIIDNDNGEIVINGGYFVNSVGADIVKSEGNTVVVNGGSFDALGTSKGIAFTMKNDAKLVLNNAPAIKGDNSLADVANFVDNRINDAYSTMVYAEGTQNGKEEFHLVVPAIIQPGDTAAVKASGMWDSSRQLVVTADKTVTVVNNINENDVEVLEVTFAGITLPGSNRYAVSADTTVSVAELNDNLFGFWNGTFEYDVAIENCP